MPCIPSQEGGLGGGLEDETVISKGKSVLYGREKRGGYFCYLLFVICYLWGFE